MADNTTMATESFPPKPNANDASTPPTPGSAVLVYSTAPPLSVMDDDEEQPKVLSPTSRAGLNTVPRLIAMTGVGSFWGFTIGCYLGGRQSGLQYLAENAHRLPTTVHGWYFYHKTKNYRVMLGGIKRGIQYAFRTGGLCLAYGVIEAGIDDIRGEADVANSVVAGVTTGALFSALTKLTRGSFRYSILFGATFGFAAGGLSDLHRSMSGQPPCYIQRIKSLLNKDKASG